MIMVRLKKGESVERGLKRLKKILDKEGLRKGSSQIRACSHPRPFPFRDGSDVSLPPNGKRTPTARPGFFISRLNLRASNPQYGSSNR